MALVGLMQTLAIEGEKYDIRVNCLAPTAATGLTEGVLPAETLAALAPERVSPGLIALVDSEPQRCALTAKTSSSPAGPQASDQCPQRMRHGASSFWIGVLVDGI